MRILIFTTAYLPHLGGAEVAIREISRRLPEISFTIITSRFDRSLPAYEKKDNTSIHRLGLGSPLDKFWLALRGASYAGSIKEEKPDLVWAMMASYGGLAALSYKKKNPTTPYLLSLQEGDDMARLDRRVFFIRKRFGEIFKKADAIQAISSYLEKWAKSMAPEIPVVVIPNGVDISSLPYKFRELKEPINIISVSRLVYKNGLDTLIRALALLPKQYILTLVGAGALLSKLKRLSIELGVENQVYFTGSLSPDKVFLSLSHAGIFARPSRSEGLGNAFLEAMASGLPVIGTPVGGIPDFLTEGKTGWLVLVDDPKALAQKIEMVTSLPIAERKEVAERARALVEKDFSWDRVASGMGKLFSSLLK